MTTVNSGFCVDTPTLNPFYSLHYALPFALMGLAILHITWLHNPGSSNPLGIHAGALTAPFAMYFGPKDAIGAAVFKQHW
jgi:quinol-cytochrome oxidoreductase complex cytochrome b subunit